MPSALIVWPWTPRPLMCKTGTKKKCTDPGRTRTYNLLLRRQTRYPLRHWTTCINDQRWLQQLKPNSSRLFVPRNGEPEHSFRSVVVITCASHAQGPRFEPGRKQIVIHFFHSIPKGQAWLKIFYPNKVNYFLSSTVWRTGNDLVNSE